MFISYAHIRNIDTYNINWKPCCYLEKSRKTWLEIKFDTSMRCLSKTPRMYFSLDFTAVFSILKNSQPSRLKNKISKMMGGYFKKLINDSWLNSECHLECKNIPIVSFENRRLISFPVKPEAIMSRITCKIMHIYVLCISSKFQ